MIVCDKCKRRLRSETLTVSSDPDECELCGGLLYKVESYFNIFIKETEAIEFSTFLIGVNTESEIEARDSEAIDKLCRECRSFKQEFTYELGTKIEEGIRKKAEFKKPDLIFTVRQAEGDYELWVRSIYVAGRYRKLRRGIPQSPWINSAKGREGEKSVSEYIGISAMKIFHGSDYNFYAAGREDVDALMLGNGRPFYIEVKKPSRRTINLDDLDRAVKEASREGVEVVQLHFASQEELEALKRSKSDKIYEVGILFDEVDGKILKQVVGQMSNIEINQQTPTRVLGIRKDIVRVRRIKRIEVEESSPNKARLIIEAEAGTYIKEFITGDNNRTKPSLSEKLGVNIKIEYLNVLEVN